MRFFQGAGVTTLLLSMTWIQVYTSRKKIKHIYEVLCNWTAIFEVEGTPWAAPLALWITNEDYSQTEWYIMLEIRESQLTDSVAYIIYPHIPATLVVGFIPRSDQFLGVAQFLCQISRSADSLCVCVFNAVISLVENALSIQEWSGGVDVMILSLPPQCKSP